MIANENKRIGSILSGQLISNDRGESYVIEILQANTHYYRMEKELKYDGLDSCHKYSELEQIMVHELTRMY